MVCLKSIFLVYLTRFYNVDWFRELNERETLIRSVIAHALQAVTTAKCNDNRDINFFSSSLRTENIFILCLNLSYFSSLNEFFLSVFFSCPLKLTREMTLTDKFALALVTAQTKSRCCLSNPHRHFIKHSKMYL